MSNKKKTIIIIGAVVAALITLYMGLSIFFMSHFYFRTTINGVDVTGKTAEGAKTVIQNAMDNYELVVTEKDGTTDSIVGSDFELKMQLELDEIDAYLEKQNGFAWIIKLFVPDQHESDLQVAYNSVKLEKLIAGLSCMEESKQIAPISATVSEYSEKKGYELVPSVAGTEIDVRKLKYTVISSIGDLETEIDLDKDLCYVQPKVADDNKKLLAAIEQLNKALDAEITYQVGESTQVLDAEIFQPWLYVDEKLNVCLNDESLSAYVKELGRTYNTCYTAKHLITSYGIEVTIPNSHYGWKVDSDAEKAAITADIMAGEPITRDLNYSMTANSHEGCDYGNSYVEINLTAQHLFLYVDGQLVLESDFVSGDLATDCASPTGAFSLTYKERDATLNGENYSTPVDFWMPFAGNVGMHDATWRSSFGATIYKRDGSHGCINLPWSNAKTIFEYVEQGFPVLVYELPGTETPAGIAMDQGYAVKSSIDAIGAVTLESEAYIASVRAQYEALSPEAKAYVTNYQVLVDAENYLAYLKTLQQ